MATWLKRLLVAALCLMPVAGWAQCRQALLLALDVSGSVDQREYRLQLDGLAAALRDPQVVAAFQAIPGAPVRLSVMEWSGPGFQRVVIPWADVTDLVVLTEIIDRLRRTQRVEADLSTAIGSLLLRAGPQVQAQGECWRRVIDVSGDGESNVGPLPGSVGAALDGVTVNGLVIGGSGTAEDDDRLAAYYRAYVLRGEEAFLETAAGFDDFEAAMVRKLLRELEVLAVSELAEPQPTPKRSNLRE